MVSLVFVLLVSKACNNEECLFDGFDCDKSEERCSMKEFCVKNYNNGRCDEQCNFVGCGWDGDNCVAKKNNNLLSGEVIMILLISPAEFLDRAQLFLFTLSQKLHASVRIMVRDERPLIYSWNSESGSPNP
ncbi:hypothetical protein AB6A40_010616 [Gnathostoma spinigerum]|uniref:LNR domain-containing protein n=1 Tax=Gnathostoma spinigerum TaxID=75299 RepID=A0ABD6EXT2_9BILA